MIAWIDTNKDLNEATVPHGRSVDRVPGNTNHLKSWKRSMTPSSALAMGVYEPTRTS